jgi:hypothetical protein
MGSVRISTPIATRQLQFRYNDGSPSRVTVTIGIPVPDPLDPTGAWACPYQIDAFEKVRGRAMFGIDAMQALILTLHTLPAELHALARDSGGQFVDEPDLGLDHACRTHLQSAG